MKSLEKVLRREWKMIFRKPVYLLGSVGVMAFCLVFYLTFFAKGMPDDLPIGVVDLDNSSMSREFCTQLDATQLGKTVKFNDFQSGREALQTGAVTSLCVIPEGMNADVQASRRPTFTYYINSLYLIGGALSYKEILTMAASTGAAVQREVLRAKGKNEKEIMGIIQPIVIDEHKVGNAVSDYGSYLNNTILPGLLELCIVFVLVYALGSELRYRRSMGLMEEADGSIATALIGKLIPYTVIFTVLGAVTLGLMYGVCHYPLAGSFWNMMLGLFVLIIANEAVAVTIIGLLPTLRYALSVAALYTILAFSFSGFTFPVEAMPTALQGLSVLFPLRHYYLFYVQEALFGAGFAAWWQYIVYMLLFIIGPFCVAGRLKRAYIIQNFEI